MQSIVSEVFVLVQELRMFEQATGKGSEAQMQVSGHCRQRCVVIYYLKCSKQAEYGVHFMCVCVFLVKHHS